MKAAVQGIKESVLGAERQDGNEWFTEDGNLDTFILEVSFTLREEDSGMVGSRMP